jgi:uncharacterized protein YggU (UPF0235/DUF167 family)
LLIYQAETAVKKANSRKLRAGESSGLAIPAFCAWDGDTLVLNILGTPAAARDAIGQPQGPQLRVSVTPAPVAGRATDHMVRFLAGEFGVSAADITVVFGRFNVNKQMRIKAPGKLPPVVAEALATAETP